MEKGLVDSVEGGFMMTIEVIIGIYVSKRVSD